MTREPFLVRAFPKIDAASWHINRRLVTTTHIGTKLPIHLLLFTYLDTYSAVSNGIYECNTKI